MMVKFSALLAVLAVASATVGGASMSGTKNDLITIDGHHVTIAMATSVQMSNGTLIALSFVDLILSIFKALNEPEFDYWGNVKEEIETMVGAYINEHNMNQVEAFQGDLETLLLRYLNAPIESDNYPTKNEQAAALSMAIISNRYMVMSGDLRFSLILHFEDIASMHLVVLKDVAETYSVEGNPSQWWVDLDSELDGYLIYSATVTQELQTWRVEDMISCTEELNVCREQLRKEDKRSCYDIYTATDGVTGEVSTCKQVHGATDCLHHCETFTQYCQQDVDFFVKTKVNSVTNEWTKLKELSSEMAEGASKFYDPARGI